MALVWNTQQLLSKMDDKLAERSSVEFHFLSRRELYDGCIKTADRHHSSAGEWVVLGDSHWYTVSVMTRPVYALPQELCLSFDCFAKTEKFGISTWSGPPIDEVAIEFGTLLSLLVREPLVPLGIRRWDGKPIKFDNGRAQISRPRPANAAPAAGINSVHLRSILIGLANGPSKNADAILASCKLYHAALSLSSYDVSTAYFSLVAALECLSGHHFNDRVFNFDREEKFRALRKTMYQIASYLSPNNNLIDKFKCEMLRGEHFVWQKFRDFIDEFLPETFWRPDELYPNGHFTPAVEKKDLRRFLGEIYNARSKFAHSGKPFPPYVEGGIADRVNSKAALQSVDLATSGSTKFVPAFGWFERLTHSVLVEYLYRIIAPQLAEKRTAKERSNRALLESVRNFPDNATKSLASLANLTAKVYDSYHLVPIFDNRVWAADEESIRVLALAGIINTNDPLLDGRSSINIDVLKVVGEFFFGCDQNPFAGDAPLVP